VTVTTSCGPRIEDVPCTVDIAHTPEDLHAHVSLHGAAVAPGDVVQIYMAPAPVGYSLRIACDQRATIVRAGWFQRTWTRMRGYFELAALYEVSFSSDRFDVARQHARDHQFRSAQQARAANHWRHS
jgi:hypothetical protein